MARYATRDVEVDGQLVPGLARMELQLALEALLTHYPTLELATGEVAWKRSFIIRGLESLPCGSAADLARVGRGRRN